jgi:hypothetical protein
VMTFEKGVVVSSELKKSKFDVLDVFVLSWKVLLVMGTSTSSAPGLFEKVGAQSEERGKVKKKELRPGQGLKKGQWWW